MQGELKITTKNGKSHGRMCILFNDMILCLKENPKKNAYSSPLEIKLATQKLDSTESFHHHHHHHESEVESSDEGSPRVRSGSGGSGGSKGENGGADAEVDYSFQLQDTKTWSVVVLHFPSAAMMKEWKAKIKEILGYYKKKNQEQFLQKYQK